MRSRIRIVHTPRMSEVTIGLGFRVFVNFGLCYSIARLLEFNFFVKPFVMICSHTHHVALS